MRRIPNMKTCWCLKQFDAVPKNRIHCCLRHGRIYTTASASEFGRDLIKTNPAAALRWYDYIR